jgi:hypothetical protein
LAIQLQPSLSRIGDALERLAHSQRLEIEKIGASLSLSLNLLLGFKPLSVSIIRWRRNNYGNRFTARLEAKQQQP